MTALSSISGTKNPLPNGPWGRTWKLAILLLLAMLCGWEALWRSKGFLPEPKNNVDLWIQARNRVKSNSVILIGTSRIQSDLEPEAFTITMRSRVPIYLAIPGGSPVPVLEDLAQDRSFSGLVIVDLIPLNVFNITLNREREIVEYIRSYKTSLSSPGKMA